MPITECHESGNQYQWNWEEAFDKFGFSDGKAKIETHKVKAVLTDAGYRVVTNIWMPHNIIIVSIRKLGEEQIPETCMVGYDDPREYLPQEIITLLDDKFPS